LRIVFDPEADAAMIDLTDDIGDVARTAMCSIKFDKGAIIARLDSHNRLIGFEILGASRLLTDAVIRGARET
jgi:uncharacterized protein YuzE